VSSLHSIDLVVYPDDCDANGQVGNPALVRLFERARWEAFARGPGLDLFEPGTVWPAVRKTTVDSYESIRAGNLITVDTTLAHQGETTFTLHQTARRATDGVVVAEGDFLIACIDGMGEPVRVPQSVSRAFGTRPSIRPGETQHLALGEVATAVDIQGDGPAILFVHGFPLDRTMWRHVIATLSGWQRIAPDLRGMGLSETPENGYSMADYADDLATLLSALRLEKAVVCGLSMGGYIAFEMFRRYRDRVAGLILINTRAEPDNETAMKGRDNMISLVERDGASALADLMMPKLLGPSSMAAMPRVVDHVRTMICGTPTKGLVGALKAMREREDSTSLLPTIDVPTLVVGGRDDQLMPVSTARQLASGIHGAQFTLIPEAGHVIPLEQPIALSRVVGEFLESLR
jgi:pimeloyl-ACP methyl ester carboxylesterase